MSTGGFLAVIIGLAITFAVGPVIVLLVALPGMRRDGRFGSSEGDRFRQPQGWTGYDDEVVGYFWRRQTASPGHPGAGRRHRDARARLRPATPARPACRTALASPPADPPLEDPGVRDRTRHDLRTAVRLAHPLSPAAVHPRPIGPIGRPPRRSDRS